MNFEKGSNLENNEKFNPKIEIGTFSDVEPVIVFYAISKKIDNQWGEEQNEGVSEKIKNHTLNLDQDIIDSYKKIKKLAKNNDETLRWLAFAINKDQEIQKSIKNNIIKYKKIKESDVDILFNEFSIFYSKIKKLVIFDEKIESFVMDDIRARGEGLPKLKERLYEAIEFFKPKKSEIKKVVYIPTNPLAKKYSGYALGLGREHYVASEKGNEINEVHEFLHGIINPIFDKLKLNKKEEKTIQDLCPEKLKNYTYSKSILTEEIIRTYGKGLKSKNKPLSFEEYQQKLRALNKEDVQKYLEKAKNSEMNVGVDEFLADTEIMNKFYNKYNKDVLAQKIWNLFEEYKNQTESFEEYFLENYKTLFKK